MHAEPPRIGTDALVGASSGLLAVVRRADRVKQPEGLSNERRLHRIEVGRGDLPRQVLGRYERAVVRQHGHLVMPPALVAVLVDMLELIEESTAELELFETSPKGTYSFFVIDVKKVRISLEHEQN